MCLASRALRVATAEKKAATVEAHRPVLGTPTRASAAAGIKFTIFTCRCVVAQDGQGTVTGIGCCTDEHADMLRSFLRPGTFLSRHPRGFSFNISMH
jgi:hypothetical protein